MSNSGRAYVSYDILCDQHYCKKIDCQKGRVNKQPALRDRVFKCQMSSAPPIARGVSILEATDGVSERADAVVHEGIVIVAPEVEGLRVRAICGTRPIAAPS